MSLLQTKPLFLLAVILILAMPEVGLTHPAGLDVDGGHHNRKTGEYHYHQKNQQHTTHEPGVSKT